MPWPEPHLKMRRSALHDEPKYRPVMKGLSSRYVNVNLPSASIIIEGWPVAEGGRISHSTTLVVGGVNIAIVKYAGSVRSQGKVR